MEFIGFFVKKKLLIELKMLLLQYFYYTLMYKKQSYLKRLISKSKRGACARRSVEIANKPFFMRGANG
jgi:hypothetical protein